MLIRTRDENNMILPSAVIEIEEDENINFCPIPKSSPPALLQQCQMYSHSHCKEIVE